MTKYAQFDPAVPAPSPVTGWFNTDLNDYVLPPGEELLTLTDEQWSSVRFEGAWAVDNGALVPQPPPTTPPPEPLTPDQVTAQAVNEHQALGIAITSQSLQELCTTFALDDFTLAQVAVYARDAMSGISLPPGFTYPDMSGQFHPFTNDQIIGLYVAQRNLMYEITAQAKILGNGGTPDWPPQVGNIP